MQHGIFIYYRDVGDQCEFYEKSIAASIPPSLCDILHRRLLWLRVFRFLAVCPLKRARTYTPSHFCAPRWRVTLHRYVKLHVGIFMVHVQPNAIQWMRSVCRCVALCATAQRQFLLATMSEIFNSTFHFVCSYLWSGRIKKNTYIHTSHTYIHMYV